MIGKRAVVIIYSVTMDSAIGVPMCDGMTVAAMGMVNGKADVIMAGISRGRLRRGNTDTLERKGQSGRHHHDNSKPSEKRLSREPQRSGSSIMRLNYTAGGSAGQGPLVRAVRQGLRDRAFRT